MTVNFEYTEHFYPLHPHATAMGKYSVFADVTTKSDEDNNVFCEVVFTSIRFKVCSLLSEGEWETLDILPAFSNNREVNEMLNVFNFLAIQKHDEEIKRREDEKQRSNKTT